MDAIDMFLSSEKFAVAGASTNREKYGNKVLRVYQQRNLAVIPVNPKADEVEGLPAVSSVDQLPDDVQALSIVTPPSITLPVVKAGLTKGIRRFWMQPGAENQEAIDLAKANDATVIHSGPCILVALNYTE